MQTDGKIKKSIFSYQENAGGVAQYVIHPGSGYGCWSVDCSPTHASGNGNSHCDLESDTNTEPHVLYENVLKKMVYTNANDDGYFKQANHWHQLPS
jgi:hypothetical protein